MKINLGCGKRDFGEGWIHIDGGNYEHLDSHDITNLQFESNTADLIYASHVVEYFDREQVVEILQEWHRVLKPGGILRLAVPDFEAMARMYISEEYPLSSFLGPLYGLMAMSDKKIYHKTTYDFSSLQRVLQASNFKNIKKYDWRDTCHANFDDHSQAYLPHMDKENGTLISLNVECVK
jgi:predicted SAM-dependent methyltransferase